MSENTHNSGRIPWNSLLEALSCDKLINKLTGERNYKWFADRKKITFFCKSFGKVLQEFSRTMKSDDNDCLDPTKWEYGDLMYGGGGQISYRKSLLSIYIQLNLILMNSYLNDTDLLTDRWVYDIWDGDGDYTPHSYMIHRFRQIKPMILDCKPFKSSLYIGNGKHIDINDYKINKVKQLTKETASEVKSFLEEVFICLVRMYQSKDHKIVLTDYYIENAVEWCLRYKYTTEEEEED